MVFHFSMTTEESYNYDDDHNPLYFYLTKNDDIWNGFDESGGTLEYNGRGGEVARGNKCIFSFVYETAS